MAYSRVRDESRDDIWFNVNFMLTVKFLNNNNNKKYIFFSIINQFPGSIYY